MLKGISPKDYIEVGQVGRPHGVKGELFVKLFAGEAAWAASVDHLVLGDEKGGHLKRLTPERLREHKQGLIVLAEEIKDRDSALECQGWKVFIEKASLVSNPGESIYLYELLNFKLFVQGQGEVGRITGFSSNTAQDLLVVEKGDKSFEIPLVSEWVLETDFESGTLKMSLPEGLIESTTSFES